MAIERILQSCALAATAVTLSAASATETIGPWTLLGTPIDAVDVRDSVAADRWLNVIDQPISLARAFSGSGIALDGMANFDTNDTVLVTFPTPLRNGPGPDLVMFDARYDDGAYTLATEFDGYSGRLPVPAEDFVFSGLRLLYFFGATNFPTIAQVHGAEIELDDLGVPEGAAIRSVVFSAANTQADPLGIGSLQRLSVGGFLRGVTLQGVQCVNQRTGQSVAATAIDNERVDCEADGLEVAQDDAVVLRFLGFASGARIGGTVGGLFAGSTTCVNVETQQSVTIELASDPTWDCTVAGLDVNAGDRVLQTFAGAAQP